MVLGNPLRVLGRPLRGSQIEPHAWQSSDARTHSDALPRTWRKDKKTVLGTNSPEPERCPRGW